MKTTSASTPEKKESFFFDKQEKGVMNVGYALLAVSFLSYCLIDYLGIESRKDLFSAAFFFHYLLAMAFAMILLIDGSIGMRKSWRKENLHKTILLFQLYFISAYSLNKDMIVFENSVPWLCGLLILTSLTLLSFRFFALLPKWINKLQLALLGVALVLYFYMTLFVAPLYHIGAIGSLFFGIGLHIFLPLALFASAALLWRSTSEPSSVSSKWVFTGMVLPVLVTALFALLWTNRISKIEKTTNESVLYQGDQLPVWIRVAQTLENDWLSQRILKSNLVYTVATDGFGRWNSFPNRTSWEEARKHDPFVFISSLLTKMPLPDEEAVKVLKAVSNGRHQAQERLWAGDNLSTSYIVSDVDIFPDLHLAYTEKYVTVRNNDAKQRWWGNSQEGIYTFQLPEGSVVTSLSLWVKGEERKAIMTSKQKADSAYKAIVGVERRDPSVIHWQEGNTVSVRVFPCTPEEERKFKIGITSPLPVEEGRLVYKNITFQGPSAFSAKETTRIRFVGKAEDVKISSSFEKDKRGNYVSEQNYNPDLQVSLAAKTLQPNRFVFDGFSYSLQPFQTVNVKSEVKKIYLDLNDSWTKAELEATKPLLASHMLYVFSDNEFIQLNEDNWDMVKNEMLDLRFSLFPFHKLKDPTEALVVTKGKAFSPHLRDIQESVFAQQAGSYFADGKKVKVFQLEGNTSTYIGSLRELRGLEFTQGNTEHLLHLLKANIYPKVEEWEEKVVLHEAGLVITKTKAEDKALASNAPDHLARLFAYNDIMRKVGSHFHQKDFVNEELVEEARSFYVVSPVSSLIVLETQQDYDRFDIKDKGNSLHNASKNGSGAVPEPHEWALIVLFAGLVLYSFRSTLFRFTL